MKKITLYLSTLLFSQTCLAGGGPSESDYFVAYAAMERVCPKVIPGSEEAFKKGLKNVVADTREDRASVLNDFERLKTDKLFNEKVEAEIGKMLLDKQTGIERGCRDVANYQARP